MGVTVRDTSGVADGSVTWETEVEAYTTLAPWQSQKKKPKRGVGERHHGGLGSCVGELTVE